MTVKYSVVRCSAVQCDALQDDTSIWHSTVLPILPYLFSPSLEPITHKFSYEVPSLEEEEPFLMQPNNMNSTTGASGFQGL